MIIFPCTPEVNFLSRVILNPGDMINYKVLFKPVVTESFIYKFNIRIKGCDQTTGILCQGTGQIPIIDRSMKGMFREIFDAGGNFTIDVENNIIDLGENIQCGSEYDSIIRWLKMLIVFILVLTFL